MTVVKDYLFPFSREVNMIPTISEALLWITYYQKYIKTYVLVSRLSKWAIRHEKISDNQYGLQKNKSTIDCIFVLHALISKTLYNKKK